jgi:hypothetical protein
MGIFTFTSIYNTGDRAGLAYCTRDCLSFYHLVTAAVDYLFLWYRIVRSNCTGTACHSLSFKLDPGVRVPVFYIYIYIYSYNHAHRPLLEQLKYYI